MLFLTQKKTSYDIKGNMSQKRHHKKITLEVLNNIKKSIFNTEQVEIINGITNNVNAFEIMQSANLKILINFLIV